jgi:hypothetical protein
MISSSIYNIKIDTICTSICMCDIPFDRSILQLSNGVRHVMPSTDRKLELTAKASMAQSVSQPAVCSNGLNLPHFGQLCYCNWFYTSTAILCCILVTQHKHLRIFSYFSARSPFSLKSSTACHILRSLCYFFAF